MAKISFWVVSKWLLVILVGCATKTVPQSNEGPSKSVPPAREGSDTTAVGAVISNANFGGVIILNDSRILPSLQPGWKLSPENVMSALDQIPTYLQELAHVQKTPGIRARYIEEIPGIQARLNRTACQAVGIRYKGKRAIFLNCIPVDSGWSKGWQQGFVKVYDGGPGFWSIVYIPEIRSFTNLHVDLGF